MAKEEVYDGEDGPDEADETTRLLSSIPPYRSVGDLLKLPEQPEQYKSRWRSIRVMYLTMFLSSVSFSICMSSIWPYLQILDPDADTNLLGWVVAIYSLGQLIASPIFGFWANFRARSREPLVVSMIINILANVLYVYLESIPPKRLGYLMLARALIGFGAGNVAVVRSYVSGATTIKERTGSMAIMSAFQATGFIIGPLIQTAMVPVGFPGLVHSTFLHMDMYTSPAILSAIVGIINVILIITIFREHRVSDEEKVVNIQDSVPSIQEEIEEATKEYSPDYFAILSCIFLFFVVLFVFAVFETITTPLSMHMFAWTKEKATLYNGIILGVAGIISIAVFGVIRLISQRVNERYLLLGGFCFCLCGFLVYLPWGNEFPNVQYAAITDSNTSSHINYIYAATLDVNTTTQLPTTTMEATGCPFNYLWCRYTPAINLAQLLGGTLLISIGYPTCNVISYTIYSKILGPKPQGLWMGWLTASGSLARTLGPVFVTLVYDAYGPRVTFATMGGIIIVTIIIQISVFKKLVPFKLKSPISQKRQF
ncbi:hypothetical protein CHS0354_011594 [Potamilus streckersoni]|uniref:Major facilitator superfamily (MFS) profile domain-containing protein n=1 Tax=Potamilus streckersoni TaxID=2493646 RepID=A0AAE0WB73_9BIVA|nr:hypothetical protein CHS0354_011594 [Potamilus streckersoni]